MHYRCLHFKRFTNILFAQPRVEVTSCCVYKVMRLTFHDRINTQLIYRFELAQVVARRITKPQRQFLGSNLTGCFFSIHLFFIFGGGIWFYYSLHVFFFLFIYFIIIIFYFFIPLTCIRHIYKTSVTTQTIYANSYSEPPPPPPPRRK